MKNFLITAAGASILFVSSIAYATPSFTVINYTNCVCMPGHTCYQGKTVSAVKFYKSLNGAPTIILPATRGTSKRVPVATGESNCGSKNLTCVISSLANSDTPSDITGPIDEPAAYAISWQRTKSGPLTSEILFSFPAECSK